MVTGTDWNSCISCATQAEAVAQRRTSKCAEWALVIRMRQEGGAGVAHRIWLKGFLRNLQQSVVLKAERRT